MTSCIGMVLFCGIIGGGIYLYYKVVRLDQEITKQQETAELEAEEDNPG